MAKTKATAGSAVRVRFAPSPTGDLHVGGVRTALFNYLYARHTGGKFLLRIEDTDLERSTPAAVKVILDGLAWLGLTPDEEIVYQGKNAPAHAAAAKKMLESGAAYRCFCTPEELGHRRDEAKAAGKPFKYDRRCLKLGKTELERRIKAKVPFALRIKVPVGPITFPDGVHGDIKVASAEIEDFVILRSDGSPTYMLAVVVDDIAAKVTHIIRGDDHISNTPKQILLYNALGAKIPLFAHVPLILGSDKKRLSKRHGATSIIWYRDAGYLPETMINYLGMLGWSPGDDTERMTMADLIKLFDIPGIQPSSAVFDENKLGWLNGQYLTDTPYAKVAEHLAKQGELCVEDGRLDDAPPAALVEAAWALMRSRVRKVNDIFDGCLYLFADPEKYDEKGVKKFFTESGEADQLEALGSLFAKQKPFEAEKIDHLVRVTAESWGMTPGKLIHPIRLAVSGVTMGAGLFELLECLGPTICARRMHKAAERIRHGTLKS